MITIYTLTDPRDNLVKYVGKTKSTLKKRLQSHESDARTRKVRNLNINWIKNLLDNGLHPIIEELESVSEFEWEQAEIFWINQIRVWGFQIKNMTIGGDRGGDWTGKHHTVETKLKIGKANTGKNNGFYNKTHSELHKDKLRNLAKNRSGRKLSEDSIKKMKSHIKTENHRKKLSSALLNNPKLVKKINQISPDGEIVKTWSSIKSAAESIGKDSSLIVAVCKGKRKTAYGFSWKYV